MENKPFRIIIIFVICIVVIFCVNFFLVRLSNLDNFTSGKLRPFLKVKESSPGKRIQGKIATERKLDVFKPRKKIEPQPENEKVDSSQRLMQRRASELQISEDDFLLQ